MSNKVKNITSKVEISEPTDLIHIYKCICGKEFEAYKFTIEDWPEAFKECPSCKRKLYYEYKIKVFEILEA